MSQTVQTFQLGTSTVVTLPKKLGIKPGQKLEIKKTKDGVNLKIDKNKGFLEALEKLREAFKDEDWEEYDRKEKERRKVELKAAEDLKKAW
jgi:bifunctional DNA-binding transcriptional regulator/antitoxin component of YhaV-PrlF toxin-antitoxin module